MLISGKGLTRLDSEVLAKMVFVRFYSCRDAGM
jgi:hypothetical protein